MWIAIAIAALVVAAIVVFCAKDKGGAVKPEPPKPAVSAAERTATKVQERLADKEYMQTLKKLEDEQRRLASVRASAEKTYATYVASHPGVETAEQPPALLEKLKASVAKAVLAQEEHQKLVKAYIGDRLRRQADEHLSEERSMADAYKASHSQYGASGPKPPSPIDHANLEEGAPKEVSTASGKTILAAQVRKADSQVPTAGPSAVAAAKAPSAGEGVASGTNAPAVGSWK